jgi:hypothetical protein
MEKKFANLGTMLSRAQAKKIVGGAEEEIGGCNVDCTGCPQYQCPTACEAMVNGVSVTCNGVSKTCHAYPTCWS